VTSTLREVVFGLSVGAVVGVCVSYPHWITAADGVPWTWTVSARLGVFFWIAFFLGYTYRGTARLGKGDEGAGAGAALRQMTNGDPPE
jgi:hypothetical protein